jgi:DsbC/DsbD-like thiol-disulfide interchange protein
MVAAFALFALIMVQAARPPATPVDARSFETRHLTLKIAISDRSATPGARISLLLDVTPKPGMHVYAPEQRDLIPISLLLDANDAIKAHPPKFPKSEKFFFAALNETQFVYSKPFRIVQDLTILTLNRVLDRAARREHLTIAGKVRYQACDDKVCFMPQEIPVSWTIELEPARTGPK